MTVDWCFGVSTVHLVYLPCNVLKGFFCLIVLLNVFQVAVYLLTAHTCSNALVLPIGFLMTPLPEEQELFQVFDLAFANTHFGTIESHTTYINYTAKETPCTLNALKKYV